MCNVLKRIFSFLAIDSEVPEVTRGEKQMLKKLDTVCHFVTYLTNSYERDPNDAPNKPISMKLALLFEELRINYAKQDKKRRAKRNLGLSEENQYFIKRIIWTHPFNGKESISVTDSNELFAEEDMSNLLPSQIHKRFILSYLHVIGMLFTKFTFEHFQGVVLQMLYEFRKLLSIKPFPVHMANFQQYLYINKLAIQYGRPMRRSKEHGYPVSKIYTYAIAVSWEMIGMIIDKCNRLLVENMAISNGTSFDYINVAQIECLFQPIQEWCLWMVKQPDIMNLSCSDFILPGTENYWIRLATLANILNKFKVHYHLPIHRSCLGSLKLPEFMGSVNCILGVVSGLLCKCNPPIFELQTNDNGCKEYISLVEKTRFKTKKDEAAYTTEIRIKPFYIILDVDCYMDYFMEINRFVLTIIETPREHVIVVPSVVLTELKMKTMSPIAKLTVQYLKTLHQITIVEYVGSNGLFESFESMNLMEKAHIESMNSGDDSLLKTCKNLSKLKNTEVQAVEGEPRKIKTDVLLVTNQKDLKSQAIIENIPVMTIMEFICWFKDMN